MSETCGPTAVAVIIIYCLSCVIAEILILLMLFKFRKMDYNSKQKGQKLFYYFGIILGITSITAIPMQPIKQISLICYPSSINVYDLAVVIGLFLYLFQFYLMQILFFSRLYLCFVGTALQLSKCTIIFYLIVFIIEGVLFIPISSGKLFLNESVWYSLIVMTILIDILVAILFGVLFIYKLVTTFRSLSVGSGKTDESFLITVNKCTILLLFSFTTTLIYFAAEITWPLHAESWTTGVFIWFLYLFDIFTNFITFMLSYKHFDKLYDKLLGCIDIKCKQCWIRILHVESQKNLGIVVSQSNVTTDIIISSAPTDITHTSDTTHTSEMTQSHS